MGNYSLIFSKIVGRTGRVLSFEPTPPTYEHLKANVASWNLTNTTLINMGLGNFNGSMEINVPGGFSGYASLAVHSTAWGDNEIEQFEVDIVCLDDYLKEGRIDFMKLDLEGAEPLAVEGAEKSLTRWLPALHIEFSPLFMKSFERDGSGFLKHLQAIGYDAFIGFSDTTSPPVWMDASNRYDPDECRGYTLVGLSRDKHRSELQALSRMID